MNRSVARLTKYIAAILLGNLLYYAIAPYLPSPARHRAYGPDLGTVVDFWFCLFVYGLLELVGFLQPPKN
jgi:hypothetical protein